MDVKKSFLGVGWSFPPRFDRLNRTVEMVSAEEDIEESLRILLSTTPGERIMNSRYGCNLQALVHEPIGEALFTLIKDAIENAVLLFESRIDLDDIEINYDQEVADGIIYIMLSYLVRQTNSRQNMVYPFYHHEGTNIRNLSNE